MLLEHPQTKVTVIQPTKGWTALSLRELWAYRELLFFLAWRDLKVRYKQTVLGVAWAIIQPIAMALLFTVVLGRLVGISADGVPYAVFTYLGIMLWNLFAKGLGEGSTSLVKDQVLITKVYFPRLILPASTIITGLVDFALGFPVLIGLLVVDGIMPTASILMLPIFVLIAAMGALGIAALLSAIDARYRDVRYTLPFAAQLWFFLTPIVYSPSAVPPAWRWLYYVNPMAGAVDGFRWALLGGLWTPDPSIWVSIAVTVALFFGGLYYFRRTERTFADTV